MCPACIPNIAIALLGLTSTSGLAAVVITKRSKKESSATETSECEKPKQQGDTHA